MHTTLRHRLRRYPPRRDWCQRHPRWPVRPAPLRLILLRACYIGTGPNEPRFAILAFAAAVSQPAAVSGDGTRLLGRRVLGCVPGSVAAWQTPFCQPLLLCCWAFIEVEGKMVQSLLNFDGDFKPLSFSLVHPLETKCHSRSEPLDEGRPTTLQAEVTFRHGGWNHTRELVIRSLYRVEPSDFRINNFMSCGASAWVERSEADPHVYRIRCDRCHDRFCVPCGNERARVIAYNVREHLNPKCTRFVTLTLRSSTESLTELLDLLYESFKKLRKTRLWKQTQRGGVAFLEVKWYPDTHRWHPHLHVLTEGGYIAQQALSAAWRKATGGSFIVDVRKIKNADTVVAYVVKYASKPHDPSIFRDPDRLDEAVIAMKGRRLCLTFGTWRGVSLTKVPDRGTWIPVARLADLIHQAASGDRDARHILNQVPTTGLPSSCHDPPDEILTDSAPVCN